MPPARASTAFIGGDFLLHAEVDDDADAEAFEAFDTVGAGFGAAIEVIIHLAEIEDAFADRQPRSPAMAIARPTTSANRRATASKERLR